MYVGLGVCFWFLYYIVCWFCCLFLIVLSGARLIRNSQRARVKTYRTALASQGKKYYLGKYNKLLPPSAASAPQTKTQQS